MNETLVQRLYDAWEKTDKDEALAVLHEAAVEITRLSTIQSAAPEIAEALQKLLERWIDPLSITAEHWEAARAALSKAKGEA